VDARIARFRAGNFGDSKFVGKGVLESRIDYGPGYRIYYGAMGDEIILLLISDKGDQGGDINLAQSYWEDYKKRVKRERENQNGEKDKLSKRSPKRSKK
jgi:putative addiction module killer protein